MVLSETIEEIEEGKEKEDLRRLEAVFFVSGRFLNMEDLISLSGLNVVLIQDLIEKLKERYDEITSAMQIVEKNGMWKMDVRPEYTDIINTLATGSAEFSKAEQETLAIIAFKQPIKQSVLIKIRGNKAYDHVKKFADLNLIKKKKEGHTNILTLSDDFYDYFGLNEGSSLKEIAGKIPQQFTSAQHTNGEEGLDEDTGLQESLKEKMAE